MLGRLVGRPVGRNKSHAPPTFWPSSAQGMRDLAGGFGTWDAGWNCEEAASPLLPAFGSVQLAAANSPRFRESGAFAGDFAVGFDDNTADGFQAAAAGTYDLVAATSLVLYLCFQFDATPSNRFMMSKVGFGAGYGLQAIGAGGGGLQMYVGDGTDTAFSPLATDHRGAAFHDALAFIDRAATPNPVVQLVTDLGVGAATDITAVDSPSNAILFAIGAVVAGTTCGFRCPYAAVGTGDIPALRANAVAAIASIRAKTGRG